MLLHRPDLLYDPQEVAEAFDLLEESGKVRYFGVSNVTPGQKDICAASDICLTHREWYALYLASGKILP